MSSYLSDNDDDLFDYDPSAETPAAPTIEDVATHTPLGDASEAQGYHKEFIDNVKNNLHEDLDADLNEPVSKINTATSNLYASFQEAIHGFINSLRNDNFSKSIHLTLDHLTNGHFSMVNAFYQYEMKIVRKLALVELFGQIVSTDDAKIAPFLQELSSVLKLNLTPLYYEATFQSSVKILNHSLTVDRIVYRFLSEKTGIPVNEFLLSGLDLGTRPNIEALLRQVELTGFRESVRDQMFNAFFNAEPNGTQQTLPEMLNEVFNAPMSYMSTFKTM